jgi:gamma-butyrobetaine dioxygenase
MAEIHIVADASAPRLVLRDAGRDTELPALWLRPRSHESSQRDATTGQRLMNPHLLPDDLRLLEASQQDGQLRLVFSDGFAGWFDPAELLGGVTLSEECPEPQPWRADLTPQPQYQWSDLDQDATLLRALHDFITLGFILVQGAPTQAQTILAIASRFGFVRDTNFGPYFEVYSRPASNDLAYRPVALGPHTDNPYRTPAPGIQILHCLQNETSGGLSTLVDSLAVAQALRSEDPQGFALLSRVPLRFEFRDASTHLVAVKPMIELDGQGQMLGVFYSPRLEDIPLMPEQDTRRYQRARRRIAELFEDPAYELRFKLDPGQFMMFDNNRVLHGRSAFDPSEGHRQLQGCYIDRDGPRSLYRVLRRRLGPL